MGETEFLEEENEKPKVWRLVLTGGPCAGKTTALARLSTFFENIGWKVYRVPESANILLSGGVNFNELTPRQTEKFQENLLKTIIQIEDTYFDLAEESNRNCLVICDRGTMDASAYISCEQWNNILSKNGFDEVELRDNRYNQVIHMVSAAKGAEEFYTVENHTSRREGIEEARLVDTKVAEAWVGHPNVHVVENRNKGVDFGLKIQYLISKIAWSIGIEVGDRFMKGAKKVKFVVNGPLPSKDRFPEHRDFDVCHNYLQTVSGKKVQIRLRRRGCNGKWSYNQTTRKQVSGAAIELKKQLTHRDYLTLITQEDTNHFPIFKIRRCFLHENQYFQLDIYKDPCHDRCKGLMLLQTYTTLTGDALLEQLPPFLNVGLDVTEDPAFSMYNLSLKGDWVNNEKFCRRLRHQESIVEANHDTNEIHDALNRLNAKKSKDVLIE